MENSVAFYEWQFPCGTVFGCGTECELHYWKSEGIVDPEAILGKEICREPYSEDERRKAIWGLADWHDKVPA